MADRNTTPYYRLFEQFKHQFCQWIFVERYTLVSVTEKFSRLFEEMSGVTGFRMRAEYENWVTRKRKWDKDWRIGQPKGLSGDTGPAVEVLEELNDLPLWWVGDERIRDLATGQILFNPPPLLERYKSRASANGQSREHKKGVDRTKQSGHTLPSSRLEPAPSFYYTLSDDRMILSTLPNTRISEAQDIAKDVYCFEEKDPGPDDPSTTAVGGPRGYGNCHWPVDPSSAVTNIPYLYHGLGDHREALCGLMTTQAPHSRPSQQHMTQEEESLLDDNSMFFMEGMPEMN